MYVIYPVEELLKIYESPIRCGQLLTVAAEEAARRSVEPISSSRSATPSAPNRSRSANSSKSARSAKSITPTKSATPSPSIAKSPTPPKLATPGTPTRSKSARSSLSTTPTSPNRSTTPFKLTTPSTPTVVGPLRSATPSRLNAPPTPSKLTVPSTSGRNSRSTSPTSPTRSSAPSSPATSLTASKSATSPSPTTSAASTSPEVRSPSGSNAKRNWSFIRLERKSIKKIDRDNRAAEGGAPGLIMQNNRNVGEEGSHPLKDLTHANLNEPLKLHNANAIKLVQTISEFAQALGGAMERHAENVRHLVDDFRNRCSESRGDQGGMRRVWESLLRQVEADATAHLDLAAVMQQQLSRPTFEGCFHRKLQSRKVFAHRETYEQVVTMSEEKLLRARADYKRAYGALLSVDSGNDSELKRAYLEAHNAYVLQLRATNAIAERYQFQCLPGLLGEIAEIYEELCGLACNCIAGVSDVAGDRVTEQAKRYQALTKEARAVVAQSDLQLLARNLSSAALPRKPPRRLFVAPSPPDQTSAERMSQVPALRDELVPTGAGSLSMLEDDLRREHDRLQQESIRLQDALDTLTRMQRKSADGNLHSKVTELQEDISSKRFDLGVAHLQLAALQAQKELFGGGEVSGQPDGGMNRKMSNGSTGSTKHKWLKAFKSLKTGSPTTPPPADKKNLESEGGHTWREYTYRKITPCDACGQVLRGHCRQGFRCRGCKVNAHADCINAVQPVNCPSLAPKRSGGIPLLRRQKTQAAPVEETPIYEPRRGSGGSTSGTRPFGQPLVLMQKESPESISPQSTLQRNRGSNKQQ